MMLRRKSSVARAVRASATKGHRPGRGWPLLLRSKRPGTGARPRERRSFFMGLSEAFKQPDKTLLRRTRCGNSNSYTTRARTDALGVTPSTCRDPKRTGAHSADGVIAPCRKVSRSPVCSRGD